jgi:hypothetical protein
VKHRIRALHAAPILLLAGCGGASHSSGAPPAPGPVTTSSSPTATAPGATGTGAATQAGTTATNGIQTTTATKPLPKPSHVRLPATFTITADGLLTPPVIAVPAGLPVQLTVISKLPTAQEIVLESKPPYRLKVPANGKASTLLGKLPKQTYKVLVGGHPKGSLSIGVQVGP